MPQNIANLPEAHQLLKEYINDKNAWIASFSEFNCLPSDIKTSVLSIFSQLNLLFAQKGWLKGGLIADYYAKQSIGEQALPPTQQELINEALQVDRDTREFTIQTLGQTKGTLSELLARKDLPDRLDAILKAINSYVKGTIANTAAQMTDQETLEAVLTQPPIMLAQELKVAFTLTDQSADPLAEKKNEGHCFGHMIMWRDNVTSNPIPSSTLLYRANPDSYQHQTTQTATEPDFKSVFSKNKTIRSAVQEIIPKISPANVYRFSLYYYDAITNKLEAHAMGIRQLHRGGYEFFDSNYGTFVFQNAVQLEKWLVSLIRLYTFNNIMETTCSLRVYSIGQQPSNAVASIPTLRADDAPPSPQKKWSTSDGQITLYQRLKADTIDEVNFKQMLDLESKELRDGVIFEIEEEMKRLQTSVEVKNEKISRAERLSDLKKLKNDILQATPAQGLSTIVNQWLEAKPSDSTSTMTHSERMDDQTRLFVNKLEEKNEINPYLLNVMRASVIQQIKHMVFNCAWDHFGTQPPVIELLKKEFENFEKDQTSLRDFLKKIKSIGILHTPSQGSETYLKQNRDLTELYRCLGQIDPNDKHWLRYHTHKLSDFQNNFLVNVKPAPELENTPSKQMTR